MRSVGEHRVLTTAQLAALGFGSVITARHRLSVLTDLGVLRRFRPHREIGSAPWHYLLGRVGAALLGAEDRDERKWLTAGRTDRQLALEHSQRLAHILGVNWFFAALTAHARTTGGEAGLRMWLNETATTDWLLARLRRGYAAFALPNPDSLGVWSEAGGETTFLLEYDTGSEHLPQLTSKLPGYGQLAQALADADEVCPLLLFNFPSPRREQAARRAMESCYDTPALRIATTAIDTKTTSPAGPVWLPLLRGRDSGGQVALSALDATLPDPWHEHRAQARERATRAARSAEDTEDAYDVDEDSASMLAPDDLADQGRGAA